MVIAKLVYLAHGGGDVYGAAADCHCVKKCLVRAFGQNGFCMYKSAKRSVIFIDISESLSSLKGRDYKRAVRIFWCRLRYNHTYRQRNMVRRKTIRA